MHRSPSYKLKAALTIAAMIMSLPSLRSIAIKANAQGAPAQPTYESVKSRNMNAFAQMFGEFRLGAADLMFVKTERYMHGGIAFLPHEDEDETGAHDESEEAAKTAIRSKDDDFRGFIGDLEREIKPWHDPKETHFLSEDADVLPWYRMITLSNPAFIRAYRTGASRLQSEGKVEQAIRFVNEGIEKNPNHPELFQLYLSRMLIENRLADKNIGGDRTVPLSSAKKAFDLGKIIRPSGGEIDTIHGGLLWTEDHEEDFVALARLVPLFLERMKKFDEALAAARESIALVPEDQILLRVAGRIENGTSPYMDNFLKIDKLTTDKK